METDLLLMTIIWALPLAMSLLLRGPRLDRAVRPLAIVTTALVVLLSLWAFVRDGSEHHFARSEATWAPMLLGIRYHVGIDGLSAVLVPVSAGIIIGIGNVSLVFSPQFELSGIALGTIVTVAVYHLAHALAPKELRDAAGGTVLIVDEPGIWTDEDDGPAKR